MSARVDNRQVFLTGRSEVEHFVRQRQHTRDLGIVVSVTWLTRRLRSLHAGIVMRSILYAIAVPLLFN